MSRWLHILHIKTEITMACSKYLVPGLVNEVNKTYLVSRIRHGYYIAKVGQTPK